MCVNNSNNNNNNITFANTSNQDDILNTHLNKNEILKHQLNNSSEDFLYFTKKYVIYNGVESLPQPSFF